MADGASKEKWNPSLISEPWQPLSIDDNQYIVKALFDDSAVSYEFCISDLKKIWYEKIDRDTFQTRSKELNPNVEAETSYLMKHVRKNVESHENTTYQILQEDKDDSKLTLQLKMKLQVGVPFVWHFDCQCTDEQAVSQFLIGPLVAMVAELLRRQSELQKLLHKKDMEISDYRESEVKLSRKSLETKKFDEESFKNKILASSGFGHVVASADKLSFSGAAQELYKQVVEKSIWLRDRDPTGVTDGGGPSIAWDDRFQSVFSDSSPNASPQTSPKKTPVVSPAKPATIVSPSKERELQRREELRRKLDEEATKKKRKKKKIAL